MEIVKAYKCRDGVVKTSKVEALDHERRIEYANLLARIGIASPRTPEQIAIFLAVNADAIREIENKYRRAYLQAAADEKRQKGKTIISAEVVRC